MPLRKRLALYLAVVGGVGATGLSPAASASGFAIPEISVAGIGTANALVANPEETGAVAYNPAAMAFRDHSSIAVGLILGAAGSEVTTASGNHDSEGKDVVPIPSLQGVLKASNRVSIGLGVNAPFGLETQWRIGTFPQLSTARGLYHPTESELEMLSIVPAAVYQVNDDLSLAAGLDYYKASEVKLNTGLVQIEGDGDGWGWSLGVMYRRGPLSLGASYHSDAMVDLGGIFEVSGSPSIDAKTELDLPFRLQLGVRYAFNDKLALEFDWSRLGWSTFDEIVVTSSETGAVLNRSANQWEDADAYRLGITYDLTPSTQLRLGYAYDRTGQTEEYFTARIPDADRQLFSIGAAYSFGNGWQLEGGYTYVLFDDNDYRGNRSINSTSGDANGTFAYDGYYETDLHVFGLSLTKTLL